VLDRDRSGAITGAGFIALEYRDLGKRVLVFPGQGSQAVGMGVELAKAFASAREVFEEADDALGQNLSALMADGPAETLTLTENAQPALLATSIAVLRVLGCEAGFAMDRQADFVAGHSLGEYSALTAAGAFTLADAVRLVRKRGQAMQDAVPVGTGAMAALLNVELEAGLAIAADAAAATGLICAGANDNGGGQLVISGHKEAVDKAIALALERGVKRAMLLPVSAPFHSPLMAPAAAVMAAELAAISVAVPVLPVVANVTAQAVRDPDTLRRLLVEQVTGLVRWRETILFLKDQGITEIVELGAGKVLAGLVRRIDKDIAVRSVGTPADLEAFHASL
jgi:[acyl-carrier-protein] S-malonyltransferase